METERHGKRWSGVLRSYRLPLYVIIVAASLSILTQMISGFEHDVFTDDAYYYAVVARNFVQSGRVSFDGISETNGFHPLLFWLELAIAALLGPGASPFEFYSVLVVFFAVLLLAFMGALIRTCLTLAQKASGLQACYVLVSSVGLCLLWRHLDMFYSGMESTLVLPLAAFTIILLYMGRYTSAGLVGAAVVAARLDTFPYFVLPIFVLYGLHEWRARKDWFAAGTTFLRLVSPAAAFIVLYMIFNHVHFGAWMPISGALRASFPRVHFQLHNLQGKFPSAALLMAIIGALLLVNPRQLSGRARLAGFACVLVTLTQLASFVCFQKWAKPVPAWYQGLPLFTGLAGLGFGVANYLSLSRLRVATLCYSLLIAVASSGALVKTASRAVRQPDFDIGVRAETVDFIRSTPKGELWAYTDCGQFAFWSDRRFENLDGVINDYEYQNRLRRRELGAYLTENDTRYLIAGVWDRSQIGNREYEPMYKYRVAPEVYSGDYDFLSFYVYSYLYDVYSEKLLLPKAAEVWRSSGHVDGNAKARFVVYDLKMAAKYARTHDEGE